VFIAGEQHTKLDDSTAQQRLCSDWSVSLQSAGQHVFVSGEEQNQLDYQATAQQRLCSDLSISLQSADQHVFIAGERQIKLDDRLQPNKGSVLIGQYLCNQLIDMCLLQARGRTSWATRLQPNKGSVLIGQYLCNQLIYMCLLQARGRTSWTTRSPPSQAQWSLLQAGQSVKR
jgi:hypothetical protein